MPASPPNNGLFMHLAVGTKHIAAGYRRLAPGEWFTQNVNAVTEAVIFVRQGQSRCRSRAGLRQQVREMRSSRKAPAELELRSTSSTEAIIVHALAPPQSGR